MPKLGAETRLLSFFPWIGAIVYLSMKLKKNKYELILKISLSAPKSFSTRSRMMMESNLSWIAASCFPFYWFGKAMLKYAWRIPESEINNWKKSILDIFGSWRVWYKLIAFFGNIIFTSLIVFSIFFWGR
ncbi:hypothetical protein BZJ21_14075 [Salinivibrio costicola subsp. alcaliphilus]|uniref:Uncharacterized protein n=1 Tax=Salinivibrio costicola subsp. alcaliphilus TaxID=272773 RepID=A0ABX3KMV8_SALCS|nr:hypothetical protein BZJ21_14075 [Salinivibrio costicola subsp. alcaliphilus]